MSWESYTNWLMKGTVFGAAIIGKEGAKVWCSNMPLDAANCQKLVDVVDEKRPLPGQIMIGEEKYISITNPNDRSSGRFSGPVPKPEKGPSNVLVVEPTATAVVCALTDKDKKEDIIRNVHEVSEYLKSSGY